MLNSGSLEPVFCHIWHAVSRKHRRDCYNPGFYNLYFVMLAHSFTEELENVSRTILLYRILNSKSRISIKIWDSKNRNLKQEARQNRTLLLC